MHLSKPLSSIISGGAEKERLAKALNLIPFEIKPGFLDNSFNNKISSHPDINFVLPENSIGISQIKEIESKITLKPVMAPQKVVIVFDAEKMTVEAQNAFLKTLEEPPEYVMFILMTVNHDLLLPTVISRCRIFRLSAKPDEYSAQNLEEHAKILAGILNSRVGERLEKTADIAKTREEAVNWLEKTIHVFRNALICHCGERPGRSDEAICLQNLSSSQILALIRQCQLTKTQLEKNVNVRLALDNLILIFPL